MTKITDTHQADRLYKAIVKDGWAARLEFIDAEYASYIDVVPEKTTYLAHIYDEKGDIVETHEFEMTQDAADVWLSGGLT